MTFQGVGQSFRDYCYSTQQSAMAIVMKAKELRNDPEFFQKVCQVALSAIQLAILHHPGAAYLSKFSFALQTANMHDFYSFLKQPRQWFFPVSTDTIDENATLFALTDLLISQFEIFLEDAQADDNESPKRLEEKILSEEDLQAARSRIRPMAESALSSVLKKMGSKACTESEFKYALENHMGSSAFEADILAIREGASIDEDEKQLYQELDLNDLTIVLKHVPLLEKITNTVWTVVDMGCILLYSKGWNLIDTAKWADRIGQHRGFGWVKGQHLERWVLGLVTIGFAGKMLEACRKLMDEALTKEERFIARWNVVTSATESILWGTTYLQVSGKIQTQMSYIYAFAILTKSIGLLSIVFRPKHQYFQQSEPANV